MEQRGKFRPPATAKSGGFRDADMQAIIGWILRIGIILSMGIVVIGGVLFVYRHGQSIPDYHVFKRVPYFYP